MSLPLHQTPVNEEHAWWLRYGARGIGAGGGGIAIALGLFNCIGFSAICVLAGIWQMLAGFVVLSAEAPCCCMFIDFVERYSKWVDTRPPLHKAIVYVAIALPPVFMCFTLSTFFGSGLIFICGALYGLMAIGKKGSRDDMIATASTSTLNLPTSVFSVKSTLVKTEAPMPTS